MGRVTGDAAAGLPSEPARFGTLQHHKSPLWPPPAARLPLEVTCAEAARLLPAAQHLRRGGRRAQGRGKGLRQPLRRGARYCNVTRPRHEGVECGPGCRGGFGASVGWMFFRPAGGLSFSSARSAKHKVARGGGPQGAPPRGREPGEDRAAPRRWRGTVVRPRARPAGGRRTQRPRWQRRVSFLWQRAPHTRSAAAPAKPAGHGQAAESGPGGQPGAPGGVWC
jgi:hypothetical protein